MDAKTLEAKLNTVEGWKSLHGGGLFGGKGKKSLANWQAAGEKGVAKLYTLRRDEHDEYYYAIFAFSTKGNLSDAEISKLTDATKDIPLGNIRYDSKGNSYFQTMDQFRTPEDGDARFNEISIALSDPDNGLFVIVRADSKRSHLNAPFVVWGLTGDKIRCVYNYVVSEKQLKKLR